MLPGSVLALVLLALPGISPVRALPVTAHRFICYMSAMSQSGQNLSLWDKVTYSLVLAGPNPKQAARAHSAI